MGAPQPELFIAYAQVRESTLSQAFVVVRTADDPAAHVETLRTALREEDPTLALDAVMTMDQRVGRALSRPRLMRCCSAALPCSRWSSPARACSACCRISVTQRSRELAVRTALGASRAAVVGVALKQIERRDGRGAGDWRGGSDRRCRTTWRRFSTACRQTTG